MKVQIMRFWLVKNEYFAILNDEKLTEFLSFAELVDVLFELLVLGNDIATFDIDKWAKDSIKTSNLSMGIFNGYEDINIFKEKHPELLL